MVNGTGILKMMSKCQLHKHGALFMCTKNMGRESLATPFLKHLSVYFPNWFRPMLILTLLKKSKRKLSKVKKLLKIKYDKQSAKNPPNQNHRHTKAANGPQRLLLRQENSYMRN